MGEATVALPQSPVPGRSGTVSAQAWEQAAAEGKKGRSEEAMTRTTTEDPITGPVQAGLYTGRITTPMLPTGKWRLREAQESPKIVWLVQSKGILSTTSPLEKGLKAPDAAIRDVWMRKTLLRQIFWGPSKPSRRF